MKVHPKLVRRWAEIYLDKWDNESHDSAKEWANRVIPRGEIKAVQKEMREIRISRPKRQT